MEINVEISIKADLLEKIPDCIKSKCVALVLDQLQKVFVSGPLKDYEKDLSCEEKRPQNIYTYLTKFSLESSSTIEEQKEMMLQDIEEIDRELKKDYTVYKKLQQ